MLFKNYKNAAFYQFLGLVFKNEIIKKYFVKTPGDYDLEPVADFIPFKDVFAIDIGEKFNSTDQKIKWISRFNSYRNLWAHEGTKEKRLNKEEVKFLEKIHSHFFKKELCLTRYKNNSGLSDKTKIQI